MYADFGKEDVSRNYDTTTSLTSRLVSPVYLHSNTGKMFTAPDKRSHETEPVILKLLPHEYQLLVKPFDLHGKRIPPERIAQRAYSTVKSGGQMPSTTPR